MITIYLIRHGEAEGNALGRFQGHTDGDLTEKGIIQAKKLGERMREKNLHKIYSSDLKRAYETALAISDNGRIPVEAMQSLREINAGEWENKSFLELESAQPELFQQFMQAPHLFLIPGGESYIDLRARAVDAFKEIVAENKGKRIAIVSHGAFIRTLVGYIKGLSLTSLGELGFCNNTAVTKIIGDDDGQYEVRYLYDDAHCKGI